MKRTKTIEALIIGFALFAMFFGAGNLIFPPSLGVETGQGWLPAGIGFLITGVGMPLLGVLAFARVGSLEHWADKVSPKFNLIYCTVLALVIGPFFATPRTGSTTFELGVLPTIGEGHGKLPIIVTSVVFFAISYVLTVKESKITDIIGKYLTPIILIILIIIGVIGFTTDIGTPVPSKVPTNIFSHGFVLGYQTMDALASILFAIVIMKDLVGKGIEEKKEQQRYLQKAGVVAAIGLGVIYFMLIFLGSKISGVNFTGTTGAAVYLAKVTLGHFGAIVFGICVALACLTTAVGTTAFVSDWLARITPLSYKTLVLIVSVFSALISMGGVDMIVKFAVPVLLLLYPVTIVLILLNLFGVEERIYFKIAAPVALIISCIEIIGSSFGVKECTNIVHAIPLGQAGFAWIVPFICSLIVAFIISKLGKREAL